MNPDRTANPNATPGAGYGIPIRKERKEDNPSMKDFMRRCGDYQQQRNASVLAATANNQGVNITHRSTTFPPASLPQQHRPQDPRKPALDGGKPFAFALGRNTDGATIWWGVLLETITQINATRHNGVITSITQPEITGVLQHVAVNLDADTTKPTQLDWFGNVYAYWESDSTGVVSNFEIKGPDVPDGENIGAMAADFSRVVTAGKYYILIGTAPEDTTLPIDQQVSSDIPWFTTIVNGTDTNDGSEGSTGSNGSTSSTGSNSSLGSDKSTAIVPCGFHSTGYTALFTLEAPDVRFEDVMIFKPRRRKSRVLIDPKFFEVCEKDSVVVISACPSDPAQVGAVVNGKSIQVSITARKIPGTIAFKLSGIRRGFAGMRFPTRTQAQFEANERFLQSAYPRK